MSWQGGAPGAPRGGALGRATGAVCVQIPRAASGCSGTGSATCVTYQPLVAAPPLLAAHLPCPDLPAWRRSNIMSYVLELGPLVGGC